MAPTVGTLSIVLHEMSTVSLETLFCHKSLYSTGLLIEMPVAYLEKILPDSSLDITDTLKTHR